MVGPGPGSPDNTKDIGVVKDLWKLAAHDILPIFGVCLGLQSLAIEHGAALKKLHTVKHGMISQIHHSSAEIFEGLGHIRATRYHSLHVDLEVGGTVEELAWSEDEENGRVVMAVKHSSRPFWAVQYHPESICTDSGGLQVVKNFWRLAKTWNADRNRKTRPWSHSVPYVGTPWPSITSVPRTQNFSPKLGINTSSLQRSDLSVVDVCEIFGASDESGNFVCLESASQPGRFSIIGVLSQQSLHIQHQVGEPWITLRKDGHSSRESLDSFDPFSWIGRFMKTREARNGHAELPFWGGLVGYLSYELGVQSLGIPQRPCEVESYQPSRHPDINLVYVERSVVIDSCTGIIYIQSLLPDDTTWMQDTLQKLISLSPLPTTEATLPQSKPNITYPAKAGYISRIQQAKDYLSAGDSYEICLTAQTKILIPNPRSAVDTSSSWERYKRLRKANPAPHSAYLRLHPSTLLSSSPERFLSYSRPPGTVCQLRPIKGTVRKAPHISRAVAEKLLVGSPKEVAENLMIVDLIRHDLHGVLGQDVKTKQFCSVEEYETVWQLVSVIEGSLGENLPPNAEDQLGWQVLQRSLPPGQ